MSYIQCSLITRAFHDGLFCVHRIFSHIKYVNMHTKHKHIKRIFEYEKNIMGYPETSQLYDGLNIGSFLNKVVSCITSHIRRYLYSRFWFFFSYICIHYTKCLFRSSLNQTLQLQAKHEEL